jgi:hypothetical protein
VLDNYRVQELWCPSTMFSFQSLVLLGVVICTFGLGRLLLAASGPLRSVPGPLLARFTRLWYLRAVSKGDFEKTNIELHRKHGRKDRSYKDFLLFNLSDLSTSGKIVRIGPNHYSIDDPEAAAIIYNYNNVFAKPDFFFSTFQPPDPNMANSFSVRDNKRSVEWRRYFAPAYAAFLTYETSIEDCAKLLDQKLKDFVDAGLPVNLGHWMMCFAFDVNGVITVR